MVELPECSCGSKQAGLIFIRDENRYQCGNCVCRAYADLAEISKITLDEVAVQGVRNMDDLCKGQDKALRSLQCAFDALKKRVDKLATD